jgi:hypothetical protein
LLGRLFLAVVLQWMVMNRFFQIFFLCFITASVCIYARTIHNTSELNKNIPYLEIKGTIVQLVVDGKPFLILGGEFGNSTFTSLEYMVSV